MTHTFIRSAQKTLDIEAHALRALSNRLDDSFVRAIECLLGCKGKIVISGIGKSGHIAKKMAATFASTGSPAFFMHAAEAIHGDLGMISDDDVLILISYSGSAAELVTIIPVVKRLQVPIIAMTGNPSSELARLANVHLNVHVDTEACPLNLAPTASTTATLALGDALAICCLEAKGFTPSDFARSHPGGALGKKLLTHVEDIMRKGKAIPIVSMDAPIIDALAEITEKGMGMTTVVDQQNKLIGIFTDGDLRRLIHRVGDIRHLHVHEVMSYHPLSILPGALAIEAVEMMDRKKINSIPVYDTSNQMLVGALHMHDLMSAKVV